jgi:hypothetical protein
VDGRGNTQYVADGTDQTFFPKVKKQDNQQEAASPMFLRDDQKPNVKLLKRNSNDPAVTDIPTNH